MAICGDPPCVHKEDNSPNTNYLLRDYCESESRRHAQAAHAETRHLTLRGPLILKNLLLLSVWRVEVDRSG